LCHLFLFATGLLKDFHLSYFSLKLLEGNTVGTLKKTMKKNNRLAQSRRHGGFGGLGPTKELPSPLIEI